MCIRDRPRDVDPEVEGVERPRDVPVERVAVPHGRREEGLVWVRAGARDEVAPAAVRFGDESGREKGVAPLRADGPQVSRCEARDELRRVQTVSYTHLTLPTILRV